MRKKFSVLSIMLIMCVVTIPSAGVAGEKITLSQWLHSNPAWVTASETLARQYESKNPNVRISVEPYPYETLMPKILTAMASGAVPDIIETWGDNVPNYRKANQLVPLMTKSEAEKIFYEAAIEGVIAMGETYAMPREICIDTGFLQNVPIFREAGVSTHFENFDEFIAAGQKLTRYDKGGNLTQIGLAYSSWGDRLMMGGFDFIKQLGGDLWQKDGKHMNLTSPEAVQGLTLVTDLTTKYHIGSPVFEGGLASFTLLYTGQAAMAWVGPWAVATGTHEYPEIEVDYTMGPSLTHRPRYTFVGSGGGWCLVVPRAAKYKEIACQYIKFCTSEENMRTWNLLTGTIPSIKALENDPTILKKSPYLEKVFPVMESLYWVGPIQNFDRLQDSVSEYLMKVLYGDTTLEKIAPALEKDVNAMIDEYLTSE